MAAFPFGGHPTLADYIAWAREDGCRAQSGVSSDEDGMVHTLTRIVSDDCRHVVVVGVDQTERLAPTMVAYLDRRLGLQSPFSSLDENGERTSN